MKKCHVFYLNINIYHMEICLQLLNYFVSSLYLIFIYPELNLVNTKNLFIYSQSNDAIIGGRHSQSTYLARIRRDVFVRILVISIPFQNGDCVFVLLRSLCPHISTEFDEIIKQHHYLVQRPSNVHISWVLNFPPV